MDVLRYISSSIVLHLSEVGKAAGNAGCSWALYHQQCFPVQPGGPRYNSRLA